MEKYVKHGGAEYPVMNEELSDRATLFSKSKGISFGEALIEVSKNERFAEENDAEKRQEISKKIGNKKPLLSKKEASALLEAVSLYVASKKNISVYDASELIANSVLQSLELIESKE